MMRLIVNIINYFFLVKQIVSKEGEVHFRRYRLLETPWKNIYIHNIRQSDKDHDFHDHPWSFESLILFGAYLEFSRLFPDFMFLYNKKYYPGDIIKHHAQDVHQIVLLTPSVWTLVVTSGRKREWGYRTKSGWIDHKTYRKLKNENKLDA